MGFKTRYSQNTSSKETYGSYYSKYKRNHRRRPSQILKAFGEEFRTSKGDTYKSITGKNPSVR